jgi:3-oxoacyl-[acyl-carrier protein] reductase
MDLGIAGRSALVCAASKGLGRGCAEALAQAGVDVTIVARTEGPLRRAAQDIGAQAGRAVRWVACDITTDAGRAAALAACPQPDILVNNAGGPPPGDFRTFDREDWIRAVDANMLTPIALVKATVDGMIARRFGASSTSRAAGGPGARCRFRRAARPAPFP